MPDYYTKLLEISQKYLGLAASRFVRRVLSHIGSTELFISEQTVREFAEEINSAVGKSLSPRMKEQFKQDVLDILESE